MIIRNVTRGELCEAVSAADRTGNLRFNNFTPEGRGWRVTLRVCSSRGRYHRRGMAWGGGKGRHLVAACYHGHYAFMRELFKLAPGAVIRSHMATFKSAQDLRDNDLEERNIGSRMYPMAYGDACDCEGEDLYPEDGWEEGITRAELRDVMPGEVLTFKQKLVKQGDLTAECWPVQVWGLSACKGCEFLDTPDCGGAETRRAMLAGERPATGLPSVTSS